MEAGDGSVSGLGVYEDPAEQLDGDASTIETMEKNEVHHDSPTKKDPKRLVLNLPPQRTWKWTNQGNPLVCVQFGANHW